MNETFSDTSPWGGAADPSQQVINQADPGRLESSSTTGYTRYRDGEAVFEDENGDIVETHPLAAEWGRVVGTLSNQLDLIAALNAKAALIHTHVEAEITDLDKYTKAETDALLAAKITGTTGEKKTGVDGGALHEMSIMDDYVYLCVTPGVAGVAIWKKFVLFNT